MQTPPVSGPPKLLDQLRHQIRRRHYSIRTEDAYVYWARWFIRFHGLRHPRDMGASEVEAFLTSLAVERKVSASTQNQALSAILFLYREVLKIELPWLDNVVKAKRPQRMPVVLTRDEVQAVLARLDGASGLILRLAYGTGMRILETARLRVKDIDFARNEVMVRDGKGFKDRVTMLPSSLTLPLREHLVRVRALHARDIEAGFGTCICRMRLSASIRRLIVIGRGSMFFRRSGAVLIRAAVKKGGITQTRRRCSATCAKLCATAVLRSSLRRIPCVTALPRICSKAATIFVRCRSYLGMPMLKPP